MKTEPLVTIRGLTKTYSAHGPTPWKRERVSALTSVDLEIPAGTRMALVGRSGSGKSTLARCVARLETPDAGEIWMCGRNLLALDAGELTRARRDLQIIFQQSATAMNPRFTAADCIAEPLRIQRMAGRAEGRARALELMERVGLPAAWGGRSSLEFSGGERQRLALARALILQPKLLILDEALSGLDSTTQERISQLLLDIQREERVSYLFITHDLLLASRLVEIVTVMDAGRIVESAPVAAIFEAPQCTATRELIRAMPDTRREAQLFHFS